MPTATYTVSGMTCGHCVSSVQEEVSAIDGVTATEVDLASGALRVHSGAPVPEPVVLAAVTEAGYSAVRAGAGR